MGYERLPDFLGVFAVNLCFTPIGSIESGLSHAVEFRLIGGSKSRTA